MVLDVFHESVLSVVDAAGRTSLSHDYAAKFGQLRLQVFPDPASQVLARWVLKTRNIVEVMMVELVFQRLEGALDIGKVAEPTHVLIDSSSKTDLNAERVTVQAAALMSRRHIWEQVSCLERKFLIDFQKRSSRYPEIFMGL
jgi:hypothetical protein